MTRVMGRVYSPLAGLVTVGLLLLSAAVVVRASIYVDEVGGNDITGDGSASAPYQSFTPLVEPSLRSLGTSVHVEVSAGVYSLSGQVSPSRVSLAGSGALSTTTVHVLAQLDYAGVHVDGLFLRGASLAAAVIEGDDVSLVHSEIAGSGNGGSLGGCVIVRAGGRLRIEDTVLTSCTAHRGGAIAALTDSIVHIIDSTFTGCRAVNEGDALALLNVERAKITGTSFSGSSDSSDSSGTWIVTYGTGDVVIENSEFDGELENATIVVSSTEDPCDVIELSAKEVIADALTCAKACESGYEYGGDGGALCVLCPAGVCTQYDEGNVACDALTAGAVYTASVGCDWECGSGFFRQSSAACGACVTACGAMEVLAGVCTQYSSPVCVPVVEVCSTTPAYAVLAPTASNACEWACIPGYGLNMSTDGCVLCSKPTYSVSVPTASDACAWACLPGFLQSIDDCVACPKPTYAVSAPTIGDVCAWECLAGYSENTATDDCDQCMKPTYAVSVPTASDACAWECNAGYVENTDSSDCVQCAKPTYAVSVPTASDVCAWECLGGYDANDDGDDCIQCTKPTYAVSVPVIGDVCAWECLAGYVGNTATDDCDQCMKPTYAVSVPTASDACAWECLGGYDANDDDDDCILCTKPTYAVSVPTASDACAWECLAGYDANDDDDDCIQCTKPTYAVSAPAVGDVCAWECNAGYVENTATDDCDQCMKPTYAVSVPTASDACAWECLAGYDANDDGDDCIQCTKPTYAVSVPTVSDACAWECLGGYDANDDGDDCIQCTKPTYAASAPAVGDVCAWECNAGYVESTDGSDCVQCAKPTYAVSVPTASDACAWECLAGYDANDDDDDCIQCTKPTYAVSAPASGDVCAWECVSGYTLNGVGDDCVACTACVTGMYETAACSAVAEAMCAMCTGCGSEEREVTPCSRREDTVCSTCGLALANGVYGDFCGAECGTGFYYDGSACVACTASCGAERELLACGVDHDVVCAPCGYVAYGTFSGDGECSVTCEDNYYFGSGTCIECDACNVGFERITCNADSLCTACPESLVDGAVWVAGMTCVQECLTGYDTTSTSPLVCDNTAPVLTEAIYVVSSGGSASVTATDADGDDISYTVVTQFSEAGLTLTCSLLTGCTVSATVSVPGGTYSDGQVMLVGGSSATVNVIVQVSIPSFDVVSGFFAYPTSIIVTGSGFEVAGVVLTASGGASVAVISDTVVHVSSVTSVPNTPITVSAGGGGETVASVELTLITGGTTVNYYCTSAPVEFVVPSGVHQVRVEMAGAGGASGVRSFSPGAGGYAFGYVTTVPGETLTITTGCSSVCADGSFGYPDGGAGGESSGAGRCAGGGGGSSRIQRLPAGMGAIDVIVAGGGGGGGAESAGEVLAGTGSGGGVVGCSVCGNQVSGGTATTGGIGVACGSVLGNGGTGARNLGGVGGANVSGGGGGGGVRFSPGVDVCSASLLWYVGMYFVV